MVHPWIRVAPYSLPLPCSRTHACEGQQLLQWSSEAGYLLSIEHVQFTIDSMFHLFDPSPAWNGLVRFSPPLIPQVCLKHIYLLGVPCTAAPSSNALQCCDHMLHLIFHSSSLVSLIAEICLATCSAGGCSTPSVP